MVHGRIGFNREVEPGYFLMSVTVPDNFVTPLPGQFVMVRVRDRQDPLLGRPFSIYAFERQEGGGALEILYRVLGKGTQVLSRLGEGDDLEILGPLGTPFRIPTGASHVILVAGGLGVAPLTYLAYHYRHRISPFLKITGYLGAKSAAAVLGLERLQDLCSEVIVTTDDGTMGTCGCVTDAFFCLDTEHLRREGVCLYACGPRMMMKCLADQRTEHMMLFQVSLEERMACGVGACLGCAVALKDPAGASYYGRVCRDGPVFDMNRVDWDG